MADSTPTNMSAARDSVEAALRAELSALLDGTVDQIDGPLRDITNRLVVAARRGHRAMVDECKDQLLVELEIRKMAARAGFESTLSIVIQRGLGLLFDGLVAGLTGVGAHK